MKRLVLATAASLTLAATGPAWAVSAPAQLGELQLTSSTHRAQAVGAYLDTVQFSVATSAPQASRLTASLNGQVVQERSFIRRGTTPYSQLSLHPQPGWHTLTVRAFDARGAVVAQHTMEFGVAGGTPQQRSQLTSPTTPQAYGRFTGAQRSHGVEGLGVTLYVDPIDSTEILEVGRGVTGADGMWTIPLTNLTPQVREVAAKNGGVLNVRAVAQATMTPRSGPAVDAVGVITTSVALSEGEPEVLRTVNTTTVPTGLVTPIHDHPAAAPTSAQLEQGFAARTARLSDVQDVPTHGDDEASFVSATASERTEVNPYLMNGVDYSTARIDTLPTDAPRTSRVRRPGDDPGCHHEHQGVREIYKRATVYPVVLEGHAGTQSSSTVRYDSRAGTAISVGISQDLGKSFRVTGTHMMSNQHGFSSGWDKHQSSKQWRFPFIAVQERVYTCRFVGGDLKRKYLSDTVKTTHAGILSGDPTGRYGKTVAENDSYYVLKNAGYYHPVPSGSHFIIDRSKSFSYKRSAAFRGFSFESTTTRSSNRHQRVDDFKRGKKTIAFYPNLPITGEGKLAYTFYVYNTHSLHAPWQP